MPGKEKQIKAEQKKAVIHTEANQEKMAGQQAPKQQAPLPEAAQKKLVKDEELFREEKVIANSHALDAIYDGIYSKIKEDEKKAGGTMEAADYLDLEGEQILEKLKSSFENSILTKELKEAIKNLDLTDEKKVRELRQQLENAIRSCDSITGKALKAMSDRYFKHAYESMFTYFQDLNQDHHALVDTLRHIDHRRMKEGAKFERNGEIFVLKAQDIRDAEEAEKKVLGGSSALKVMQTTSELRLTNEEALTDKQRKSRNEILKKYRKKNYYTLKPEEALELGKQGIGSWSYSWDPAALIRDAKKHPDEKTLDKDGKLVPRELELYQSDKDLGIFENQLRTRMLEQLAEYCGKRYELSLDREEKQKIVSALKETLGESKHFSELQSLTGTFLTKKGNRIEVGGEGLDLTAFTGSAAVKQMDSFCSFIRTYLEKSNEQVFYREIQTKDRSYELQSMMQQGTRSVEETFREIRKAVEGVLKANFKENEITFSENDTELQKMEKELAGLKEKNLDECSYGMSYNKLYALYLTFREALHGTIREREYQVGEGKKKVTQKKSVIDISPEPMANLEKAYGDIRATMEQILENYKEEKKVEGSLEDALAGEGAQWEELRKEPLWAAYSLMYTSYSQAVEVARRFKKDLEVYGASKDSLIGDYFGNITEVREMLANCEEKLENSKMSPAMAEDYRRVQELQKEYALLRKNAPQAEYALLEAEKIREGRNVYKALEKYDSLRTEFSEKTYLTKSPQGRKLLKLVYDMKEDFCQKLLDEKKEELAYYEGSLLKQELSQRKKADDERKQRRQQENGLVSSAEEIVETVAAYKEVREKLESYLKRYSDIKESCYYVKEFELRQEEYSRKIKEKAGAMVVSLCDEVTAEMEQEQGLYHPIYRESSGEQYRKLRDQKDVKLKEQDVYEYLDDLFDFSIASRSLDKGGLQTDELMKHLDYPAGFREDENRLIQKPKGMTVKVAPEILKSWYQKKAAQFLPLCLEMKKKLLEKSGNAVKTMRNAAPIVDFDAYLLWQTSLGEQVHVLVGMVERINPDIIDYDKDELQIIDAQMIISAEEAEKQLGIEAENRELTDRRAVDAYHDLKVNNNLETRNDALREDYFKQRDEADEKAETSVRQALDELEATEHLRSSNSRYFADVLKAARDLRALEASKTASYDAMLAAYQAVRDAASVYIAKRDNWKHAHFEDGKRRLAAVKALKAMIEPRFSMLESFRRSDHTYEDRKAYLEKQTRKLEEFKRSRENPAEGRSVQEFLIEFKKTFKKDLKSFDADDMSETRTGVEYMTALKREELTLERLSASYLIEEAEKLKMECLKNDPTALDKEARYRIWAKCYSFCSQNRGYCPEEAKHSLEIIDMLGKRYVDEKECRSIKTAVREDQEKARIYAESKQENMADMLRLLHKYDKFLKGVKNTEIGAFVPGFAQFVLHMSTIKVKTKDVLTPEKAPQILEEARKKADEKLEELRGSLEKHGFLQNEAGSLITERIREGLSEIAFLTDTFGFLQEEKNYGKEDARRAEKTANCKAIFAYYERQRENLEKALTSYALRDVVIDDLGFRYQREQKKDQTLVKGYGTISRVKLADERLAELEKDGNRLESADAKKLLSNITHIVMVETEKKQLGDLKKLAQNQPEMAIELERQKSIRVKFEAFLKKEKDPEHRKRVTEALDNQAGIYNRKLQKKLRTISGYHLDSSQEPMAYYVASLSKTFDEVKQFLKLVRCWDSSYDLGAFADAPLRKLQDTVLHMQRRAEEGMKQKGFRELAKNAEAKVQGLKTEDALMRYSTKQVCEMRDSNFAMTLQNLGSLKLGTVGELHINDKIKAERMRYASNGYDKMKIKKYWSFKLFGYTLWGKDVYGLDDFIKRVEHLVVVYENDDIIEKKKNERKQGEELKTPFLDLLEHMKSIRYLAGRLGAPEKIPEKELFSMAASLKKLIRKLDNEFQRACLTLSNPTGQEDHKEALKEMIRLQEGWKDYFVILNTLPEQVEAYLDRRTTKGGVQNYSLRSTHKTFMRLMAQLTKAAENQEADEIQEKCLVEALGFARMCTNAYAESALEHNLNMECGTYSEYLSAMAENKCFRKAQKTLTEIQSMRPEDRKLDAGKVYQDYLRYISRYYLATGIGREAFKQMKKNMDVQMEQLGVKSVILNPEQLRELQKEVHQKMQDEILVPEAVEGDKNSKAYEEIQRQYKEVADLFGVILIRSLHIDETNDAASRLKDTADAYKKASERLNGKGWLRMLRNVLGHIIPV